MRRRLRKKKSLGEFAIFGFDVAFSFRPDLPQQDRNDLIDRFLVEAIEGNNLLFGGGGLENWSGFVVPNGARTSATDDHRNAVERWLASTDGVVDVRIGRLCDANYDREEELQASDLGAR